MLTTVSESAGAESTGSAERLIHPHALGATWPEGGRVEALRDEGGQFLLDVVVGAEAPLRLIVDPLEPGGPSFARTPNFRLLYRSAKIPPGAMTFLQAVAKAIDANDRVGRAPRPKTSPAGTAAPSEPRNDQGTPAPPSRLRVPFDKRHLERRLEQLRATWTAIPEELEVIVTNPCEMGCLFCPQGDLSLVGRESPFDHRDELDQVSYQIQLNKDVGAFRLRINGNDPLLHPHLEELIKVGLASGFREIVLQSPGLRLCDNELARSVVAAGVTGIDMPFYSHREELFSTITGIPNSKAQADQAVKNLLALGIAPSLHGIAIEASLPELGETLRYIKEEFGLPYTVHHFVPHHIDPSKHRYMPSYELVRPAIAAHPEAFAQSPDFPLCLHPSLANRRAKNAATRTLKLFEVALPFEVLDNTRWRPTHRQMHADVCARCTIRERCGGTFGVYLEQHGTAGLEPVL